MSEEIARLFSLAGRTAVITGGAGAIGGMIARGFLMAGARVFITGRDPAAAESRASALREFGDCRVIVGDVGDRQAREQLVAAIRQQAPEISILVNNAAITGLEPFGACTDSTFDDVHEINFKASFMLIQGLHDLLKANASPARPAQVINIGSAGGITTYMPASYSYCAGKAALHHLTRGLARELAPHHIQVNAIAPGVFPSNMTRQLIEDEEVGGQMLAMIPAGRWGEPDDMAMLAIAIAANPYLVGVILPLDGGITLTA